MFSGDRLGHIKKMGDQGGDTRKMVWPRLATIFSCDRRGTPKNGVTKAVTPKNGVTWAVTPNNCMTDVGNKNGVPKAVTTNIYL